MISVRKSQTRLTGLYPELSGFNAAERMMVLDSISYFPDDILVKVDRSGMRVSREVRVLFLYHRLVEFVWSLPLEYKPHERQTTWRLLQVLYRHVPPNWLIRKRRERAAGKELRAATLYSCKHLGPQSGLNR